MSYYFKINGNDYSMYVNKLQVGTEHNYEMRTSAGGADRVTYKYNRKILEVGIIPLDSEAMARLLSDVNQFRVTVSFRDPITNAMVEDMPCIIPSNLVDYYTIQAGNVTYKAFSLSIREINYIGEA